MFPECTVVVDQTVEHPAELFGMFAFQCRRIYPLLGRAQAFTAFVYSIPGIQINRFFHFSTILEMDIIRSVTTQRQTFDPGHFYIYGKVVLDILVFVMVETCKVCTRHSRVVTTFDSRPRFTCWPPCRLIWTGTTCITKNIARLFSRIFGIFQTGSY